MAKHNRFVVPIKKQPIDNKSIGYIILSAGIGTRAKSHGVRALWEIKYKPLIYHQIESIRNVHPKAEIAVVTGFEADKVIESLDKYSVKVVENQLYESQGQVGSLKLGLLSTLLSEIVVIHGDMLFNKFTLENLVDDKSSLVIDSHGRIEQNKVGVRGSGIAEHLGYCWHVKWGQICYLTGKELQLCKKFVYKRDNNKLLTYEMLEYIIDSGGTLHLKEHINADFKEINSIKDL